MSASLLHARCDPYGAESRVRLLGGMYPESWRGRLMWHCQNRAEGRWRMVCVGGEYGQRTAPDGGLVAAYACPGGHVGQPMALCPSHVRSIQRRQAGLCPPCAWPPVARALQEQADDLQLKLGSLGGAYLDRAAASAPLLARLDQVTAQFAELMLRGRVHRCPLLLVEVS